MKREISVVIPTYKEPDYLDLCIKSAISGQSQSNQIIVVVDGHYEENKGVLSKYKDQIEVLDLGENQGLPRATNLGVYNSKNDLILIVNDDNVFPVEWDKNLLAAYTPGMVLSPNQIEPTPSIFNQFNIHNLGESIKDFDEKAFNDHCLRVGRDKVEESGSTLPYLIAKKDYLRVGGWDENYPTNGVVADWDFFLKCNLSGLKLMRTYNCHFYHFAQVATGKDRGLIERDAHEYSRYKWGTYIKHNPYNNIKHLD